MSALLPRTGQPPPPAPPSTSLSPDEQLRASRFHFDRDRHMFIACRAKLRALLAQRTGTTPESLHFEYGSCGKPFLPGAALRFNLSHAGPWFACALSSGADVGVDLEHVHPLDDLLAIARHFFAPAEVQHLAALPQPLQTPSFFECWTRKEAVIKATGEGISRPLDSFEVAFGPGIPPALLRLDEQTHPGWLMQSFAVAPDILAAVTSPDGRAQVHTVYSRL